MTRFARIIVKWMATVFLVWLAIMFLYTSIHLVAPFIKNKYALAAIVTFIAGIVIFSFYRFNPVYIFGHELTHWIVAKFCFLKFTGKFRISKNKGSVEVEDANVWITLAPYFVPLYAIAAIGIYGLTMIKWYPSPQWLVIAFSCIMGLAYAYHCVLTFVALRLAQSDLDAYGRPFSFALIAAGNILFILLAILMVGAQWKNGLAFFCDSTIKQWCLFVVLLKHISALFQ